MGKPHCADTGASKKRVNILGALNYAANALVHSVNEGSTKRAQVVQFIDQLAQKHTDQNPIFIVMDNSSIHHNIEQQKLDDWLREHRLIIFYLPPYNPELSPIEIVWKQAKYFWRKLTT